MKSEPAHPGQRFQLGDAVRMGRRKPVGHCRAPWYLRGKSGIVVGVHGVFRDPERLAYHLPGWPALPLYKVRFRQIDIWPDYTGSANDDLEVDVYEPWLDVATAKTKGKR